MVWPAVFALIVPWSHPSEKSRLIGFSSAGSAFGNVIFESRFGLKVVFYVFMVLLEGGLQYFTFLV